MTSPDSDKLDALPLGDVETTAAEKQALEKFFPKSASPVSEQPSKLRTIALALVAFLILGNPWLDKVVSIIPMLSSSITLFLVKAVLFIVVMWCLLTFVK